MHSFLRCEPLSLQRCLCVSLDEGRGGAGLWVGVSLFTSPGPGYLCRSRVSFCRPVGKGLNASL